MKPEQLEIAQLKRDRDLDRVPDVVAFVALADQAW
jgi:hypothetical protein